jgi:hypothetical protein
MDRGGLFTGEDVGVNRDVCEHFVPVELSCIVCGESYSARSNPWHYPAHNLDLPNLPQPGETVVAYYLKNDGIRGPTIITPVDKNGPLTIAGKSIY